MSSRDVGQGFNWRQILIIGAPVVFSIVAVATIYMYYSRNKRKGRELEIHSFDDVKKDKKSSATRPLTPSLESEEEAAALKLLLDKKAEANNCFARKEYERAVELYTQLIEECSPLPALRADLSKIYHNRAVTFEKIKGDGYLERVIRDCDKAIELEPKYAKARARRAKAFEEVGDVMNCLKDWTLVNLMQPELANSDASFHRVDQLIAQRGMERAIEKMKTHVVMLPSKIHIEEFINMFSDIGLYTDATLLDLYRIDTCKRHVSAMPLSPISLESAENGVTLSDTDSSALETSNAVVDDSSVDSDMSEEELRKCLEAEPFWQAVSQMRNRQYSNIVELTSQAVDTGCRVFKPHALLVRSTFYLILNKYVQAIEDVNVIIMDENTPPEMQISALLRRSCAKEVAEEFKSALEDFETALNIDPNNHIIFFVRSKFYSSEENLNFDNALADINKCLQLCPDNNLAGRNFHAMLKFKLASASQSQVEIEKVKRHLRETMKQFPDSSETIGLYSRVLLDVQEIREAIEYLDKAIQLEPDNGTLLVYRAQARLSNKGGVLHQGFPVINNPHLEDAVTQAIEEMEYALRIDEQCRLAMEVLATLYSQRGESDRAVRYLEMAIKHIRSVKELAHLETFLMIVVFQPEINKEVLSCGLDPETLQDSLNRQQL